MIFTALRIRIKSMHYKNFSLLVALDALLAERSVARAASRMNLSTSAMSRVLGQIRELFNDQILIRAGRKLVPTPKAEAIRQQVREIVEKGSALLASDMTVDLSRLDRVFTLRITDSFVASLGLRLISLVAKQAPHARIRFSAQGDEDPSELREGLVDLDIGVIRATGPEIKIEPLFRDNFIGAVRAGHPLAKDEITPARFAQGRHISVSRRGLLHGPMDTALEKLGLAREVMTVVPTFTDALLLARSSNLVTTVPERMTESARYGMYSFQLPAQTDPVIISMAWHPRFELDAAHQWLRTCVQQVCREN